MGWFGMGATKQQADEGAPVVQKSMDSVAIAKKRMELTKAQRDAAEAEWAKDDAEIARMHAEDEAAQAAQAAQAEEPARVSIYNPNARPAKPAAKGCMKKTSKFAGDEIKASPGACLVAVSVCTSRG